MADPVLMIALSPTMNEGTIVQWFAQEGQEIKTGDALCEVETDKATMTYEAPSAGTLLKIIAGPGTSAVVGQLIAVVGKPGDNWEEIAAKAQAAAPAAPAQPAAPAAAPPAPPPPPAPAPAPAPAVAAPVVASVSGAAPQLAPGVPRSSPVARKLAQEKGLDLRGIRGSGPGGRIIARDVEQAHAAPAPAMAAVAPRPAGSAPAAATPQSRGLRGDRVPLSKMRSIIATRLHQSYSQAPHYFVRVAIEMDRLLDLRKQLNAGRDPALSLNAFIVKLAAAALERNPGINASWEGDAIQYLPHADIGLAVALPGGLITPVIRACEAKGLEAIDQDVGHLVAKARAGGLLPEEYTGASFTISNLGSYGVEEFTAIINPPGSAILALGAVTAEPVVRDGAVVVHRILHATLSSDHRVIDGALAAAFLADFKALCEEPARALL
ncbi:MAG TPA: dihydrolipoamide acetyltransferase family protein [Kiritimatiellia bacterium]|jgi:pyruvate dehydrogenase E2 component (dihydrolipoamide acetyltransferase)|nr:2-oxo acid dehydrogenase subunit E2 [Kiritimatiellia bacterium]MBP9572033.1 2-oxo acid dehydrogenase subunit E2 [Kiritimatiellia bacterium]HPV47894.1 dihydrolipoamide acetyltransferase family protein [Kiritimatiellia bacterium]HQF20007.1 dihydrolipoamide acetyltransferase family protein [Kiritimatiellia bacterium]HQG75154.1 dihydrolipoamide acetyltransferase family protein [Kiritimatiellia bacterium]